MDLDRRISELLDEERAEHTERRDRTIKLLTSGDEPEQLLGLGRLLMEIADELRNQNFERRYKAARYEAEDELGLAA